MRIRLRHWLYQVMAVSVCIAHQAIATTFVPMTVEDLTRSSVAAVIGTVEDLTTVRARQGRIFTLVTLAVDQVLRGDLRARAITLKEDGGTVAGQQEILFGEPSFGLGERVLLFLTVRSDGSLRTNHLALGKFRIDIDAAGTARASQQFGPGTMVLVPPGVEPPAAQMPLRDLVDAIKRTGTAQNAAAQRAVVRTTPPEANDPSLPREVNAEFTLLGPGRFFEVDEGMPVSFLIDPTGDSILGFAASRQAVDNGMAAWTNVGAANIVLQDGGTADVNGDCPGPNAVLFNDPNDMIPNPTACHGVLAVGGFCTASIDSKMFNGTKFSRAQRARLTFANGWNGCAVWTACNLGETATHELGHSIGLGHSSERSPEPNATLRDATMYFEAHFDGRCAGVRSDDIDGVSFIYPTAIPPTILTADPLPVGTTGIFYSVALTVTGGSGGFSWTLQDGDAPGLSLSTEGIISGIPDFTGNGFFEATATDSHGDNHTKVLNINVNPENPTPTPSPTATIEGPAGTATPTRSATSTPVATPAACVGDCDRLGTVTVDEILTMVNVALETLGLAACTAGDANHDGTITVDEILAAVNSALVGCA